MNFLNEVKLTLLFQNKSHININPAILLQEIIASTMVGSQKKHCFIYLPSLFQKLYTGFGFLLLVVGIGSNPPPLSS